MLTATLSASLLLFINVGPSHGSPRSIENLWDLGHVLLFALLTRHLFRWKLDALSWTFPVKALLVLTLGVFIGLGIEWVQTFLQKRTASVGDVRNDLAGCFVGLAFLRNLRRPSSTRLKALLRLAAVAMVLLAVWPLATSLVDEYRAMRDFPVLGDFETSIEIGRWTGSTGRMSVAADWGRTGRSSLKVDLATTQYSGVSLRHFPRDWRGWTSFCFSVYKEPGGPPLKITCRIHDREHDQTGMLYRDRFNRNFILKDGWNDFEISLADVETAPPWRRIDLSDIRGVGFFVTRLNVPTSIRLDNIRLK